MAWGSPILVEDFAGNALDTARWLVYNDPNGKTPRIPGAVRVESGELQLVGGFDERGKDVSGGIASRLNQLYGRWEVRFRIDRGAGYSAAVLLWPKSERWPDDGEIDLAEINRGARDRGNSFLHNGSGHALEGHPMTADFTNWHTVAVDWLPGRITFYLDGAAHWTVTRQSLIPNTSPMHLTLQNDQGCDAFIECRNAATPARVVMHVDWVKVYRAP